MLGRKLQVTYEIKQLLMLIIINIAVPAIILNGILSTDITDELFANMLVIFIISIAFNILGIGIGWLAARLFGFRTKNAKKIAILAGIGNTGFIGIPLCAQIFGPTGGLLAAIFDAGLDVVVFTLVIILLQQGQGERFSLKNLKAVINVPILAIIIGMTIAIVDYQPPIMVHNLAAMLSSLAAPLAMIYIGLLIPSFIKQEKKVPIRFVIIPLILKLLAFPVIAIVILQALPIAMDLKLVTFIQVTMPTFMLATVLFARYANDEDSAVITTIYSTLLSLLTIPLLAYMATFFL